MGAYFPYLKRHILNVQEALLIQDPLLSPHPYLLILQKNYEPAPVVSLAIVAPTRLP